MTTLNFKHIKRICIIGGSGSGKTTLSLKLSQALNLPVWHLDGLNFKENWQEIPKDERDKKIKTIAKTKEWIIEGNYLQTLQARVQKSDLVIFLDYSLLVRLVSVLKRFFTNHNQEKGEIPGCKEKFDLVFCQSIFTWNQNMRPKIQKILKDTNPQKVLIFKRRKSLRHWLKSNFN